MLLQMVMRHKLPQQQRAVVGQRRLRLRRGCTDDLQCRGRRCVEHKRMAALNAVVTRVKHRMFGACDAAAALLVGAAVPMRTPPI